MLRLKNLSVLSSWGSVLLKALITVIAVACTTVVLAGSGVSLVKAGNVFKAGKFTKSEASLATLAAKDLRYASQADNVAGILELAQKERRIDTIEMIQMSGPFSSLRDGDKLLLRCLQYSSCQPDLFLGIARTSELHAKVIFDNPALGYTQVNHAVGAVNESLMVHFYTASGWQSIDGQVGRTGFDGLFVKRDESGVVRDLLIVESKYNQSILKPTNYGMQMSDEWVRKKIENLRRLDPDDATYRQVEALIDRGAYRARIWNMRIENDQAKIELKSVHSKDGYVRLLDSDDVIKRPPRSVDLANPHGTFEKRFATWYQEALGAVYNQ